MRRLDALRLQSHRPVRGSAGGIRRSARRGASVEFADYREYVPGDDLRSVDWNAYGRLEKLYLKQFIDDQDLSVHLLIDISGSMAFGVPQTKLQYAAKLAAALGYIALAGGDRVTVSALQEPAAAPVSGLRGPGGIGPLFSYLALLTPGGDAGLRVALTRYVARATLPGIAIVLSDFYDDAWASGVKALAARGFQIVLAHVLAPEEINPALAGEMRLQDAETNDMMDCSVSPALLETYHEQFVLFCAAIEQDARRYNFTYFRFATDLTLFDAVRHLSGIGGFLRAI